MKVRKFFALSIICIIVMLIVLWFKHILQLFNLIRVNLLIVLVFIIIFLVVLFITYKILFTIIEFIFDTLFDTYKIHNTKRKVINKDSEDSTFYVNTGSLIFPITDRDYYIYVNIDGSEERLWIEESDYKKVKVGDIVEVEKDDMYRFGIYVSTEYYFVRKISKKK